MRVLPRFLTALILLGLVGCGGAASPSPTAVGTLAPSAEAAGVIPSPTTLPTATGSEPTATPESQGAAADATATPSPAQAASSTPETLAAPTAAPDATPTPTPATIPEMTATPATADAGELRLALEQVADGFDQPLYVANAGDASGRLFVIEQAGVVKILEGGSVASQPFLDITDRVGSGGNEQGLLSIAFHPSYATNGIFYVDYTDKAGDTIVARYSASGDTADPASEQVLLKVDQPYPNHNGGLLMFGPDGYLYIGLGDGGSGGDPQGNGQNLESLLGKILRIDVNSGDPYAIPADNPFASGGGRPEIWAYGLRNPWRFSFDAQTGDLFIGDVGQNQYEEISLSPAGQGGLNFGWNPMEASRCYTDGCDPAAYVGPIAEYSHSDGCSVTGGYVYRGAAHVRLQGIYLYGDYCSGTIWALQRGANDWESRVVLPSGNLRLTSFGVDQDGELYAVDRGGVIYRIGLE